MDRTGELPLCIDLCSLICSGTPGGAGWRGAARVLSASETEERIRL